MDHDMLRLHRPEGDEPIPFPVDIARKQTLDPAERDQLRSMGIPGSPEDVLSELDNMSRKIDDLAKELGVMGFYDDDPDRPRAA